MNPNLMDFSRLDLEWLKTIVSRLKEAGIDALRIDDICGACIPAVYKHHAWEVKQILGPDIPLAIHSHNDFELGTAGQLAALEGGAEVLEGCINGLGERAGVPNLAVLGAGARDDVRLRHRHEAGPAAGPVRVGCRRVEPAHPAAHGGYAATPRSPTPPRCTTRCPRATSGRSTRGRRGSSATTPTCRCATTPASKAIQRTVLDTGWDPIDDDVAQRVLERVRHEVRQRRREPSDRVLAADRRGRAAPRLSRPDRKRRGTNMGQTGRQERLPDRAPARAWAARSRADSPRRAHRSRWWRAPSPH